MTKGRTSFFQSPALFVKRSGIGMPALVRLAWQTLNGSLPSMDSPHRVPVLTNLAYRTIWTGANFDILCSLNSALADLYGLGLVRCSYSVREDSSRLVPNTETAVSVLFAKTLRPAGS